MTSITTKRDKMAEPENGLERHLTADQKDEEELAEFGYKQELKRDWGLMHNFGISFSIIVSLWQFIGAWLISIVGYHWYHDFIRIWIAYRRTWR